MQMKQQLPRLAAELFDEGEGEVVDFLVAVVVFELQGIEFFLRIGDVEQFERDEREEFPAGGGCGRGLPCPVVAGGGAFVSQVSDAIGKEWEDFFAAAENQLDALGNLRGQLAAGRSFFLQ